MRMTQGEYKNEVAKRDEFFCPSPTCVGSSDQWQIYDPDFGDGVFQVYATLRCKRCGQQWSLNFGFSSIEQI